jgi:hypothetical protein
MPTWALFRSGSGQSLIIIRRWYALIEESKIPSPVVPRCEKKTLSPHSLGSSRHASERERRCSGGEGGRTARGAVHRHVWPLSRFTAAPLFVYGSTHNDNLRQAAATASAQRSSSRSPTSIATADPATTKPKAAPRWPQRRAPMSCVKRRQPRAILGAPVSMTAVGPV